MATVTANPGFNSSDTITSTTLNNHVNNATVTNIVNADIANNAAVAFTKLAAISTSNVLGSLGSGNVSIPIVGNTGILKNDDSLGTSDTIGATQGNIKAYVDTEVANFPVTAPTGTTVATCGTVTLPGGLILKFGQGSSTIDADESFSFKSPAFPNNCFAVIPTITSQITAKSTTGFTMNRSDTAWNGSATFDFIAIGN